MLSSVKRLVKVSEMFKRDFNWSDKRVSKAMMRDLFLEIHEYYQKQMTYKYNPVLSKRIDLIQALLDTYDD